MKTLFSELTALLLVLNIKLVEVADLKYRLTGKSKDITSLVLWLTSSDILIDTFYFKKLSSSVLDMEYHIEMDYFGTLPTDAEVVEADKKHRENLLLLDNGMMESEKVESEKVESEKVESEKVYNVLAVFDTICRKCGQPATYTLTDRNKSLFKNGQHKGAVKHENIDTLCQGIGFYTVAYPLNRWSTNGTHKSHLGGAGTLVERTA